MTKIVVVNDNGNIYVNTDEEIELVVLDALTEDFQPDTHITVNGAKYHIMDNTDILDINSVFVSEVFTKAKL